MEIKPPTHVAIIMDGNRRWAKKRNLPPTEGHKAGVDTLEKVLKIVLEKNIKYLTIYALSTENLLNRSKFELGVLFSILKKGIEEKVIILGKNHINIRFLGNLTVLPENLQNSLKETEMQLSKNKKLFLNVCLNYGGRDEIIHAIKSIRKPTELVDTSDIENNLYTSGIPDPDLIIRTGGQKRLSNFLLWQSSYSELFFTDTFWPDFDKKEFNQIINSYYDRKRNFGK